MTIVYKLHVVIVNKYIPYSPTISNCHIMLKIYIFLKGAKVKMLRYFLISVVLSISFIEMSNGAFSPVFGGPRTEAPTVTANPSPTPLPGKIPIIVEFILL